MQPAFWKTKISAVAEVCRP